MVIRKKCVVWGDYMEKQKHNKQHYVCNLKTIVQDAKEKKCSTWPKQMALMGNN